MREDREGGGGQGGGTGITSVFRLIRSTVLPLGFETSGWLCILIFRATRKVAAKLHMTSLNKTQKDSYFTVKQWQCWSHTTVGRCSNFLPDSQLFGHFGAGYTQEGICNPQERLALCHSFCDTFFTNGVGGALLPNCSKLKSNSMLTHLQLNSLGQDQDGCRITRKWALHISF